MPECIARLICHAALMVPHANTSPRCSAPYERSLCHQAQWNEADKQPRSPRFIIARSAARKSPSDGNTLAAPRVTLLLDIVSRFSFSFLSVAISVERRFGMCSAIGVIVAGSLKDGGKCYLLCVKLKFSREICIFISQCLLFFVKNY